MAVRESQEGCIHLIRDAPAQTTSTENLGRHRHHPRHRFARKLRTLPSSLLQRIQLMGMGLPVLAIERADNLLFDGSRIQTPRVHAQSIRMRARNVERLHATDGTEEVLRCFRMEPVAGQTVSPRQQAKARFGNDEVPIAELRTDRTVALIDLDGFRCVDFESNSAAMTPAPMRRHSSVAFSLRVMSRRSPPDRRRSPATGRRSPGWVRSRFSGNSGSPNF